MKRLLPLNTSTQHDTLLISLIATASGQIERYLNRHVLRTARTEQYRAEPMQRKIFLRGYPVASSPALTLKYSPLRDFTVADDDDSLYYVNLEDGVVEYDFPTNYTGYANPGAFQVVYTGGMAASLQSLSAAISGTVGSISATDTVTGDTSGASGTVTAITATTITITVLYGVFEAGETLTKSSGNTTVLGTFTASPLCIAYPEIIEAANLQTAWLFQRREQVGLSSVSSEGVTVSLERTAKLLTGVVEMIDQHRRHEVSI